MNALKLGWINITRNEKLALVTSIGIAVVSGYQSLKYGFEVYSVSVLGPMALMAFALQSLFLVGLIRGRSRAMNFMFVELMQELRDAKFRLGEEIEPANIDLVAKFLGDKK